MKKYWYIVISIYLTVGLSTSMLAQQEYSVRLNMLTQSNEKQICYNIQLASAALTDFNLAGQNYRLYYDTGNFRFNKTSSQSLLPKNKYSPLVIKDNLTGIDATGVGTLPFESSLGFLNIGTDLNDTQNGGIILPSSGEWISTAQICFDFVGDETSFYTTTKTELFWARPELTATYATAYLEVAQWIAPFQTIPAKGINYEDISLSTGLAEQLWQSAISIYPNPTKGKVWLKYEGEEIVQLKILGVNGAIIRTAVLPKGTTVYPFDLEQEASGTYYIQLTNGNKIFTEKIEKVY